MNLNHVLVLATDIEAMTRFWIDVIGLESGQRPAFPFPGSWLYSEGQPVVHIAQGGASPDAPGPIAHVALAGMNYEETMQRLAEQHAQFVERDVPESGERQIFVAGPDGLRVELLFPLRMRENLRPVKSSDLTREVSP